MFEFAIRSSQDLNRLYGALHAIDLTKPDPAAIELLGACFEIRGDELFWKTRPAEHFKSSRIANSWNAKHAGRKAGSTDSKGYLQVKVFGRLLLAHRVLWMMREKTLPDEIDHVDGSSKSNGEVNLRPVTHQQNMQNQKLRSDNKSGLMGVSWFKSRGLWLVKIQNKHIGYFGCFFEACCARKSAECRLGFHANHGRTRA